MEPLIEIREGTIDEHAVRTHVASEDAGAIVVFTGTTRAAAGGRTVRYLEYEAYRPMAEKKMAELSGMASRKWPLTGVAIVHRTGRVGAGETSVVIAVSAAHRPEAFEACRFLIDGLKSEVPIWKKEVYGDGHAWAGGDAVSGPGEASP